MVADPLSTPWGTQFTSEPDHSTGVVHRRDLSGDAARVAQRQVRARRWTRFSRDVFVTHNGPLTDDQSERAVLASCPPSSALSGLTAARRLGMKGFDPPEIHVTIPCGSRPPRIDDVAFHYSRHLGAADVHPAVTPRITRIARSILDAATWTDRDGYARAIILAAVQQRLVTPAALAESLPSRGPCLRHALIVESIDDAAGGIQSLPEREFEQIRRAFGLPEPSRQAVLRHSDGRYYLDVDFEEFGVSVEVDGRPHMNVQHWNADLDRGNQIVVAGRAALRFTSYAVRRQRARVGTTLVNALMARGWQGPPA